MNELSRDVYEANKLRITNRGQRQEFQINVKVTREKLWRVSPSRVSTVIFHAACVNCDAKIADRHHKQSFDLSLVEI